MQQAVHLRVQKEAERLRWSERYARRAGAVTNVSLIISVSERGASGALENAVSIRPVIRMRTIKWILAQSQWNPQRRGKDYICALGTRREEVQSTRGSEGSPA